MTILITGIHGFVGSNLVSALKAHHSIYGLDIVSPEKDGVIKTFLWEELELLPTVDVMIHLAGKAHDTGNKSDAKVYFEINTGLTQKIFDCFLQSDARQFIFFSSVKAVANAVEAGKELTEEVVPKPAGAYGESKIKAEEYIRTRIDGLASDKKVYILRPCMIHGPGNKGNLNLLYKIVTKGIPWPLGAFNNARSFLNIWNVAWIIEQFMLQRPPAGIYHLADDKSISTNELIRIIALSQGKKAVIWKVSPTLVRWLAKAGAICRLPLNPERLKKLTENYIVSNRKMKEALGIEHLPVDVESGLKRTLATFNREKKK